MALKYGIVTLNMCLVNGINPVIIKKVGVVSYFEPLALRCEITVMPLHQVSGHDTIYLYVSLSIYLYASIYLWFANNLNLEYT